MLILRGKSGAQRMFAIQPPAIVVLHANREILIANVRRYAVENQVTERIRSEMRFRRSYIRRDLRIDAVMLSLPGNRRVLITFKLPLIEIGGVKGADAIGGELRRLSRIIWNLKIADRIPGNQLQPLRLVDRPGHISELFVLLGMIMDRVMCRSRRL